jgi:hypothetical protein
MITGLERFGIVLLAAILTDILMYAAYRRTKAAFWGYVSVWLLEIPMFLVVITGAQTLAGFDIFMHTFGIVIMAGLLVIIDILLIEISLLGFLKPFSAFLPNKIRKSLGIYSLTKNLQKHYLIPRPERVEVVFIAGILGGIISSTLLLVAGAFW